MEWAAPEGSPLLTGRSRPRTWLSPRRGRVSWTPAIRTSAIAQAAQTSTAEPRATTTGEPVQHLYPVPQSTPPQSWHLDYFLKALRGFNYKRHQVPQFHLGIQVSIRPL